MPTQWEAWVPVNRRIQCVFLTPVMNANQYIERKIKNGQKIIHFKPTFSCSHTGTPHHNSSPWQQPADTVEVNWKIIHTFQRVCRRILKRCFCRHYNANDSFFLYANDHFILQWIPPKFLRAGILEALKAAERALRVNIFFSPPPSHWLS